MTTVFIKPTYQSEGLDFRLEETEGAKFPDVSPVSRTPSVFFLSTNHEVYGRAAQTLTGYDCSYEALTALFTLRGTSNLKPNIRIVPLAAAIRNSHTGNLSPQYEA